MHRVVPTRHLDLAHHSALHMLGAEFNDAVQGGKFGQVWSRHGHSIAAPYDNAHDKAMSPAQLQAIASCFHSLDT
jgi:hypothetical protein